MYQMKRLSERKVKTHEAMNYLCRVFSDEKKDSSGNASDRTMAKVLALFDGSGRGAELASSKGTAFGLLNSVTEFVDHELRARSGDHRIESAWLGQGGVIEGEST